MKRLLSLTMIAAMIAMAIAACKDDFNEEDFLRLQSELKLKQDEVLRERFDSTSEESVKEYIEAVNEAGDLLAVSLVVRENGNALPGVTVTLSSGTPQEISSGRAKAVTTGVTDAAGTVVFDRVTIGKGTASFSKNGYVTATAEYSFGAPTAPVKVEVSNPNGGTIIKWVPPAKRYEEAAVMMISATPSEGSTATITGKVTIENDLTNLTPEVPAGIVLRANLTSLLGTTQGFFSSYTLSDNSTLGRATIASDGSYTMLVPASATGTGTSISIIVPNIEGTCRMAVNGYDNGTGTPIALTTPEYRNVPTGWGPSTTATITAVPNVPGARVVVPAAPAAGSGLSFTLSPVPMGLDLGTINSSTSNTISSNIIYRVSNRGSFSNTTVPTVTISGGGGSGAKATATLQALIPAITVTSQGSGLAAFVNLEIVANLQGGGTSTISKMTNIATQAGAFPPTLDLKSIDGDFGGFGTDEQAVAIPANTTSLSLAVTQAAGTPTTNPTFSFTPIIDLGSVSINESGSGYTSSPTFSFSAGGAAIEVLEFPVFWDIVPTMSAGTDYALIPTLTINYPQSYSQNGSTPTNDNVDTFYPNGSIDDDDVSLAAQLTISGGDIVKKFPTRSLRLKTKSHSQPTISIKDLYPVNAKFTFDAPNFSTSGAIIGTPTISSVGDGYNTKLTGQIVPSIAGAPGSGATIEFNYLAADYSASTMEWQFSGSVATPRITILTPGSGYLPNLNQRGNQAANVAPSAILVQPGKTYPLDIVYGTGQRRAAVN